MLGCADAALTLLAEGSASAPTHEHHAHIRNE